MDRIARLIAAMTLDEKIGQLTMASGWQAVTGPVVPGDVGADIRAGRVGSCLTFGAPRPFAGSQRIAVEESRLGIPLLIGLDVLHGHKTIFPDPARRSLRLRSGALDAHGASGGDGGGAGRRLAGVRADARRRARSALGPHRRRRGRRPLCRRRIRARPRCAGFRARISPTAAPSPRRPSIFAPMARRWPGANTPRSMFRSARCAKSICRLSRRPLAAGCAAVMPAFMDLAGVPMTAHRALLRGWLRGEQGFEGVIVSDYNAIAELMRHGVAADLCEAAALALTAGIDIDMMSGAFRQGCRTRSRAGARRDRGHRRQRAPRADAEAAARPVRRFFAPRGAARRIAARAGPANSPARRRGARSSCSPMTACCRFPPACAGSPSSARSPTRRRRDARPLGDRGRPRRLRYDPRRADAGAAGEREIVFAEASRSMAMMRRGSRQRSRSAATPSLVLLCVGEAAAMSGEAASRADPGLPGRQEALAQRDARPRQAGRRARCPAGAR